MVAKFGGFTKNDWIVPLKCVNCVVYKSCLDRAICNIKGSHCVLLCFISLVHEMLGNPINCDKPRDPWLQMRLHAVTASGPDADPGRHTSTDSWRRKASTREPGP